MTLDKNFYWTLIMTAAIGLSGCGSNTLSSEESTYYSSEGLEDTVESLVDDPTG